MQNIASDEYWMKEALDCARQCNNIPSPNPRVGCVIVKDSRELARGHTQKAGGMHAEIFAIDQAVAKGHKIEGSTFYVTMEPCSHYGRTPPCALSLIRLKVARVVIAMADPNPLVAGKGIKMLREAGIEVQVGLFSQESLELNPGFVSRICTGRPWVWSKIACSLDGRIALDNGASKWITAENSRLDGHNLRAQSCVVLSGIRTVQQDDPLLNVRDKPIERQPIRAIIDRAFEIDEFARLFNGDEVWIFTARINTRKAARLRDRNVRIIEVPLRAGRINLKAVFDAFREAEFNEIHVEAGPQLNSALMAYGYLDELNLYMSPKMLGSGRFFLNLPRMDKIPEDHTFDFVSQEFLDPDIKLRLRHRRRWDSLAKALELSEK